MNTVETDYVNFNIPKVDKYPPEYTLIDTAKYKLVQAIIDHAPSKKFKPSDIYYIFYDKYCPSNTVLLEYEDKLTKEYYEHLNDTISIIKTTWKAKTNTEVDPSVDLYQLLKYNIDHHRERAKILSEVRKQELESIGIKSDKMDLS